MHLMNHLLSPSVKYLATALLALFSVVSCAPQAPTRAITHAYEDPSKIAFVSLFDLPEGPQAVTISMGTVKGEAKKPISKSDFESVWNRLHSEDLSRFKIRDSSAKFDTRSNIVVKFGTMPAESMPTYVVPKKEASASLKATAASIKKLSPL